MTLEEQLYREAIKNGAGDSLIPKILPLIEAYAASARKEGEIAGRIDELRNFYETDDGEVSRFDKDEDGNEILGLDDRIAELKAQQEEVR